MLKIRLQRIGRRNSPAFRIVVTESTRGPKSGDNIELLGSYNPHTDSAEIKADRVKEWIGKGAQVSDTVHNILVDQKVIEGKKVNVLPKKSPIAKESAEEEQTETAPVEAPAEEGGEATPAEVPAETPAEEKEEEKAAEPAEVKEEEKTKTSETRSSDQPKADLGKEEAPLAGQAASEGTAENKEAKAA